MELVSLLLLVAASLAIVAYAIFVEGIDWMARAEFIQQHYPRLWGAVNNRPTRLILLLIAIVMLAHVMSDMRSGAEPPAASFAAPKVPTIDPNVKIITVTASSAPLIVNSHEVKSDRPGWVKTEFIFVPNKKVSSPVEIEMTVNGPVLGLGKLEVAEAGTYATGLSTWNGSSVVLKISSPGISPEHAMIGEVYSDRRLRSLKARILP